MAARPLGQVMRGPSLPAAHPAEVLLSAHPSCCRAARAPAELSQRAGLCLPFIDYKGELVVPRADAARCITLAAFWPLRICANKSLLYPVLIVLLGIPVVVRTGLPQL